MTTFDGTDPLEWLFQADQFFAFYNIAFESRLAMASFYMKGEALSWYKWMYQNNQLTDWEAFTRALELRFGPSTYENHQAQLFKLRQHGSVADYQSSFEKLGNRVLGLPQEALLNCFISGLIPEIRHELAIQRPHSISQAIGLAKLIKAKIKDSKPKFNRPYPPNPTQHPIVPIIPPKANTAPNPPIKTATSTTTKMPIRRLSPAQMQDRRAQGLCYNCDEKYVAGHRCATGRYPLLIIDTDEPHEEIEVESDQDQPTDQQDIYFQLSPQALTGQFSPQTLKFKGLLHGLEVTVLIDTGSTHNILQPRIANHLNIPQSLYPNLSVMVGNGNHIQCAGLYIDVPILLQNHTFTIPFYLFPIQGADVVLGMAWLCTLGPKGADFSIPAISFRHHNQIITLQGDHTTSVESSTLHQLRQFLHTDSVASMHLLTINPTTKQDTVTTLSQDPITALSNSLPTEIQTLLKTFPTIFQSPMAYPHLALMIIKFLSYLTLLPLMLNPTAIHTPKKKP